MAQIYEYWLAMAEGISHRQRLELLRMFGKEEELYRIPEYQLEKLHKIPENVCQAIITSRKDQGWREKADRLIEQEISLVTWRQKEYPDRLRNIYDPPYCLFIKGRLPQEEMLQVAVVGARVCSPYGQTVARDLGHALGEHGVGVISGMAYGVDAWAHQGSLEASGVTYGIMGCGVDICYPAKNRRLYQQIPKQGGLLSEFSPGSPPLKRYFPLRNRLISGMSDVIVVVEARKKSGSLITADYGLEQGKTVYAVPGRVGDPLSCGTNWLLSQGAAVFRSVDEFIEEIGLPYGTNFQKDKKLIENSLEKNEWLVYSVLDFTPKSLEQIMTETELGINSALDALETLGTVGRAREIYKNYFVKNDL